MIVMGKPVKVGVDVAVGAGAAKLIPMGCPFARWPHPDVHWTVVAFVPKVVTAMLSVLHEFGPTAP
jgi:hypothetical protein